MIFLSKSQSQSHDISDFEPYCATLRDCSIGGLCARSRVLWVKICQVVASDKVGQWSKSAESI